MCTNTLCAPVAIGGVGSLAKPMTALVITSSHGVLESWATALLGNRGTSVSVSFTISRLGHIF